MNVFEFNERTGANVRMQYYNDFIEPQYYKHPGNKNEFCRDWLISEMERLRAQIAKWERRMSRPRGCTDYAQGRRIQLLTQLDIYSDNLLILIEQYL